jgi:hypothetical protein
VAGVADLRIQADYDALLASNNPITPAKLATRALTGYPTALRWLKIHHPELLAPKPPATEAAAAPKPDTAPRLKKLRKPRRQSSLEKPKAPKPSVPPLKPNRSSQKSSVTPRATRI